jgi:hypothetical protein
MQETGQICSAAPPIVRSPLCERLKKGIGVEMEIVRETLRFPKRVDGVAVYDF